MFDIIVNIIAMICAPLAQLLIVYKKKSAFLIFLVLEVAYIYLGIKTGQFGIVGTAILYFFINCYGYYTWNKGDYNGKTSS